MHTSAQWMFCSNLIMAWDIISTPAGPDMSLGAGSESKMTWAHGLIHIWRKRECTKHHYPSPYSASFLTRVPLKKSYFSNRFLSLHMNLFYLTVLCLSYLHFSHYSMYVMQFSNNLQQCSVLLNSTNLHSLHKLIKLVKLVLLKAFSPWSQGTQGGPPQG